MSNNDHINIIECDVKTCKYHGGNRICNAKCVNVGPSFANSSADTICSTFKPKN